MTEPNNMESGKSLSRQSLEGTALLIATRFLVRLIGFVSVSITARLLTPEDFGLVGAASLVIVLFEVLNQIGLREYIVRAKTIDMVELQTMWTIRLTISLGIAAAIYFSAPWAAVLLQEPRLKEVLEVLSVVSILGALRSPATEFHNRNLQYGRDLYLKSADKIVTVVVTIACAYYLRSYWALVWGQLAGLSFAILSSQVARPYIPKLTFARAANVRSFAFWTFLVGLNGYGIRQIDEWIAKRSSDSAAFGAYHISRDLCRLFVAEIIAPAGHVFFPSVAKVQEDPERMTEVVGRFAGAAFIAAFAVTTGIAAISGELIYLLLGYQWGQAIPYMPYVALGTASIVVSDLFAGLYVIKDQQNIATRFRFLRLVLILVGCGYAALALDSLLAISIAFAIMSFASAVIELLWLFSASRFRVSLLATTWRPIVAAVTMYGVVISISLPTVWPLALITAIKVLAGAACYITVIYVLWRLVGQPKGGESEFIDRLKDYL